MNREERAKQFMSFDALKGLQEALRLKEYEHERILKGDLSEEKILEISKTLKNIQKNSVVEVKYFKDGHYLFFTGKVYIDMINKNIKCDKIKISFEDLFDLKILFTIKSSFLL